jgi:hypothetical protein
LILIKKRNRLVENKNKEFKAFYNVILKFRKKKIEIKCLLFLKKVKIVYKRLTLQFNLFFNKSLFI